MKKGVWVLPPRPNFHSKPALDTRQSSVLRGLSCPQALQPCYVFSCAKVAFVT